LRDIDELDE